MRYSTLIAALCLASFAANAQQPIKAVSPRGEKMDAVLLSPMKSAVAPAKTAFAVASENVASTKGTRAGEGLTAGYDRPAGVFFGGMDPEGMAAFSSYNLLTGPAYANYKFTNTSEGGSAYKWTFADEEISTERDLNYFAAFENFPAPTVTVSEGSESVSWTAPDNSFAEEYLSGGNLALLFNGMETLGAMTYPNAWYTDEDGYRFTRGSLMSVPLQSNVQTNWNNYVGRFGLSNPKLTGIANVFPAPLAPYSITQTYMWASVTCTGVFPITATVYEAEYEDGQLVSVGDVIARGETLYSPAMANQNEFINVTLSAIDEEGLEVEEPITISTAILVVFDGFADDANVSEVCPLWGEGTLCPLENGYVKPVWDNHAFTQVEAEDEDGNTVLTYLDQPAYYYANDEGTEFFQTADYMIFIDAFFNWCVEIDGKTEMTFPVEGGTNTVTVSTFDFNEVDIMASAGLDWLSYIDLEQDPETLDITLTFEAEPLEEGVEGREGYIYFVAAGMEDLAIHVQQGTLAIGSVTADKDVQRVEYYDLMGRKLNVAPQNGLFIEKAIMTDGSVKATKISR